MRTGLECRTVSSVSSSRCRSLTRSARRSGIGFGGSARAAPENDRGAAGLHLGVAVEPGEERLELLRP